MAQHNDKHNTNDSSEEMRSVPRLCEFKPGICLTTEEKHGKTSVRVVKECCYPPYPHSHYYISLSHPYSTKPKIHKITQYNYKQFQYNHTITIPTISPPTILHKPHTSIQFKIHALHPHTLQYNHTITIPTTSPPTILHKPHTSILYKTHTYTPPHITKICKTTQYNYKQIQYKIYQTVISKVYFQY